MLQYEQLATIIITKDRKGTGKHSAIVRMYMLQSKIDKLTKPFPVATNESWESECVWLNENGEERKLTIGLPIREIMNMCEKHF